MKINYLLLILFTFPITLYAQDVQFSQPQNIPLIYNAAQSGLIQKAVRLNVFHRSQWQAINGFSTTGTSIDMKLIGQKNKDEYFWIGIGFSLLHDVAAKALKTNIFSIKIAPHFVIAQKSLLSIGVGLGTTQRNIDYSNLSFESQWINNSYDPDLPTYEPIQDKGTLNYITLDAGLDYRYTIENSDDYKLILYAGAAALRLKPAKETLYADFLTPHNNKRSPQYLGYTGIKYSPNGAFLLNPYICMFKQNNNTAVIGSLLAAWQTNEKTLLGIGAGYNTQNGIIAFIQAQYDNAKLGFSYDINLGKAQTINNGKGGAELTFTIEGDFLFKKGGIACPVW